MNTSKILILSFTVLILLSMVLFIAQLLLRKAKTNSDEKISTQATGTWFITLFLSGALLTGKTISVFAEAIDNVIKINQPDPLLTIFKMGSILAGFTIVWLMSWYYLSNKLSVIITGKRNVYQEVQAGNYIFFLIRGSILIGFIFCLLPVFELLIRTFIPHVEVPFYH
jgi:hypothetical protein